MVDVISVLVCAWVKTKVGCRYETKLGLNKAIIRPMLGSRLGV